MDGSLYFLIGAIALLLLMSGFFSGSETALTATSRARMRTLERDGDARAGTVGRLIDDRERLIGAILLGNNLVNILASAIATSIFLQLFGQAGVAWATLIMTALVLVFAEVLPKTLGIARTDQMAMLVARPISLIVFLFAPVVWLVQKIVRSALSLFGLKLEANQSILLPEEEIRGTIELHHEEGGVVKGARDMLGGVLDLRQRRVDEIMVHRKNMAMLDVGSANTELIEAALETPYTRIPLWKDDPENIVGVLHAKDLLRALWQVRGDASQVKVEDVAREPWFVPETTSLQEQLDEFLHRNAHFALIVDEYGALMGLVTLEDILEEIVGEIEDEHDITVKGVRPQASGAVNVDGDVTIRDLNRAMDWTLPDEEAITIAGLVIHEAQTIPEPGQVFNFYGFRFEVLRRQRNQITALRITPPAETTNAA